MKIHHPILPIVTTAMLLAAQAASCFAAESAPTSQPELLIRGPNYPRAFFFRAAEGAARRAKDGYEAWDAEFSRLMGIIGKCLDEEVLGLDQRNPEYFSRFKQKHPEQVVLLHFNGNSRDPRYHAENFFAGHWVYRQAFKILADVPATDGESVIKLDQVGDFKTGSGRYKTSNDDIGLFGITPDGKHDWNYCEQVQLLAVDNQAKTIKVKRGCYGTKPLAFKAGKARAAAHEVEGPWGKNNNLLWFYNFSAQSPKDAQGKNCADRLVDDLAAWFGKGGKLAAFDGLEFDVMFNETHGDTDGNGLSDNGVINGVNQYGIGMVEFARNLRTRMGDGFIIQGDGALGPGGVRSQRNWGLLNGIESEGFPNLNDWDMEDWSGGLNRHNFWQANARPPVFNYINHKWVESIPGKPGEHTNPEVPFARHRLSFAAAQFTDAAITYAFSPAKEGGQIGIWDELQQGRDRKIGWLGKPEGAAIHLATQKPNLLPMQNLASRLQGDITAHEQGGEIIVTTKNPAAKNLSFTLNEVPAQGSDLLVLVTMKAQPFQGYPREMARLGRWELSGGKLSLMSREPEETGQCLRGKAETPLDKSSGAHVAFRPAEKIGGRTLVSYNIHPPFQAGVRGYVYWCKDVSVSPDSDLLFNLGMSEKAPSRSDGVWFQVWAAEITNGKLGTYQKLFEKSTKANEWLPCKVALNSYAGKRVRLKFVADCGPNNNSTTDQGSWGDVKIATAGSSDAQDTPTKSLMTWVNDRPFTSAFYFRDIKSSKVSLNFSLEGSESVSLQKIRVHAAPDAMYRVFEKGLVLANPSHAPFTFDLATISPGRNYQRLKGSPKQDSQANNGQPVPDKITLGERDALFLLRR
jgi:hypothetical protein